MKDRFFTRYNAAFLEGRFLKATLGYPAQKEGALRKIMLRPVLIRGELLCSFVYRYTTRDETKNYPFPEALERLEKLLGETFLSLHFFMEDEEVHLQLGAKEKFRVKRLTSAPAKGKDKGESATAKEGAVVFRHDRAKERKVPLDAPFLEALGVVDAQGKVRERMGDKLRQIERFVDLLDAALRESPLGTRGASITFWDMGSGKGYLTFAAHDFLRRQASYPTVNGVGVEYRADLVALCNSVAEKCHYEGLTFRQSTIDAFPPGKVDLLLALHACNTATDDAIVAGIRAEAGVMLLAPCCHKELRPQIDRTASKSPLHDILKYGTFAERHAEMLTDSLRALFLEKAGYKVKVAEFVAAEHTARNVMLIATKRLHPIRWEGEERITALKEFYGIRTCRLEELLEPLLERD